MIDFQFYGDNESGWKRTIWAFTLLLQLSQIEKSVIWLACFSLHYHAKYLVVCNFTLTIIKFGVL